MSGGVDSSVAALLLKKAGYDAVGVFMRCYNLDGCAERDSEDARRVAEKLGIPFYVWDFEDEYKERVVNYMIDGYRRGITPNPDVMCNREIKFGLFLKKALETGASFVATGHYVRLRRNSEFRISNLIQNLKLLQAKDTNKDQSYFLWTLTQDQLKHCLFPIGDYLKSEVREIARKAGLPTAEKKDSQGICFLGKVALVDFLKQYIPEKRGAVLTTAGKKIGEHNGAQFYTVGQRHIGVANGAPIYVVEKNVKTNMLLVAEGNENPAFYKKEISLIDVNFISKKFQIPDSRFQFPVMTRVRYRQPLAKSTLLKLKTGNYKLIFKTPVKFVAPGQSAVFYTKAKDGYEMLGGGVILESRI
ncbi:MAG: tRNA-specific 2-thiouridylase MnmA [Parcubacteria group bacterium GW2011_GWB1_45_9]|nr:MAG: tRNA-specific 2-thiouridylase MnmA [Parcubacteria group bacterium GW2011_GWB1_45_9]